MTDPGSVGATPQSQQQHTTTSPEGASMSSENRNARQLDVEAFSLYGTDQTRGNHVHYEADDDLTVQCARALGSGQRAGLVLVELGIDGYETHKVRVECGAVIIDHAEDETVLHYGGDKVAALDDALAAIEAVRDKLEAIRRLAGSDAA